MRRKIYFILLFTLMSSIIMAKSEGREFIVTATIYSPTIKQCGNSPLITASGDKINIKKLNSGQLRWIAVSQDFLKQKHLKFGDKVILHFPDNPEYSGEWEIKDAMPSKWKRKIDLLVPKGTKPNKWHNIKMKRKM